MTNRITTPPKARTVIVGVDTHKHVHVAVAIDSWGIRLGDHAFVSARLREWEREQYFSTNTSGAKDHSEAEQLPIVTSMRRCLTLIWHRIVRH